MLKIAQNDENYQNILNFENYYLRDEISYEDIRHGILKLMTYTFCKKQF